MRYIFSSVSCSFLSISTGEDLHVNKIKTCMHGFSQANIFKYLVVHDQSRFLKFVRSFNFRKEVL